MKQYKTLLSSLLIFLSMGLSTTAQADSEIPIMDLVDIQGIRQNQLVGYGLVVGLDGRVIETKSNLPRSRSLTCCANLACR